MTERILYQYQKMVSHNMSYFVIVRHRHSVDEQSHKVSLLDIY